MTLKANHTWYRDDPSLCFRPEVCSSFFPALLRHATRAVRVCGIQAAATFSELNGVLSYSFGGFAEQLCKQLCYSDESGLLP